MALNKYLKAEYAEVFARGMLENINDQVEDIVVKELLEAFEKRAREVVREHTKNIALGNLDVMRSHLEMRDTLFVDLLMDGERVND